MGLKQANTGVVNECNEARCPSAMPELGFTQMCVCYVCVCLSVCVCVCVSMRVFV